MDREQIMKQINACFQDSAIRDRSYYPDFRRAWIALFEKTLNGEDYSDLSGDAVYTVRQSFSGIDAEFHFDRLKINDWYKKETARGKQVVFHPKRLKHKNGKLFYHEALCRYEPDADEDVLTEDMRNIVAAALPSLPPELCIIYGNRWVDGCFNSFLKSRLSVYLTETDYLPAFLGSDFEVCLYLFMMDLCIIKENYRKVEDGKLREFLHIFRPSPMLKIKSILF